MREVRVIDTTLRDAHQCLWATRMTTAMMLSMTDRLDRAGFEAVDLPCGAAHVDVAVRYLKEHPWEKVRLLCRSVTRTPMYGAVHSRSGTGFNVVPDDIGLLWLERLAANGMKRVRIFDPLADLDNIIPLLRFAKKIGVYAVGTLAYSHSPVHTDALFAANTRELIERAGVDAILLKDAGGLLTPDRIRTLIPALRAVMPKDMPLELHSHCVTGLAPLVYLEGVKLGVDRVHTSIAPLANGEAQPATQTIVRNLRSLGFKVELDDAIIDDLSEHLRLMAEQEGKPVGIPLEYDAFHYEHQVPGGMQSNFRFSLAQAGLSHKLPEVLHECARIRSELGWPIMITPFSQIVGTQAVLNVVHGERYRIVPDEVKKYALGYYGKLLAPVEPGILDKIVANGSKAIALTPPPLEPAVPGLRKKYPDIGDEERLLRYSFAGSQVDEMLAAGPIPTEYRIDQPLVRLLRAIARRPRLARVHIQTKELRLDLSATA
ncbi:MAG: carboxylase [Burkholderiales bacterium]|nr:carboxylase [Burkholderiales bacterium]